MGDNVIKFKRPEKKSEEKRAAKAATIPNWLPFLVLLLIAVVIYLVT